MKFQCTFKDNNETENWSGTIKSLTKYKSHYEINISSRSSILVLVGKTSLGAFACMPDFNAGCHLVNPKDIFWNTEKLVEVLGTVDGITVANAIYSLSDKLVF